VKGVERADMAGSLRRMKETIGDVDFLVISRDPERVMDVFVSLPGVEKIWGKGKTKSSVRMAEGFDMDVRVIAPESYGAALQYFTGSKEHNIALRKIAIDRGFKLSEYGLFKGSKNIAARTEEEIYRRLGLQWIPPEMREDRGEIGLAEGGNCPGWSRRRTSGETCTSTATGTGEQLHRENRGNGEGEGLSICRNCRSHEVPENRARSRREEKSASETGKSTV